MANDVLFEKLQREWNKGLSRVDFPETSFIRKLPPGRYALFATLEEPLDILRSMRDRALLSRYEGRFINNSWSVRELVVHMASWARELRREVETLAAERGFDYEIPFALSVLGPTEWNRIELQKRSGMQIQEACAEYENDMLSVQDLVLELPLAILYRDGETPFAPSGEPTARWRASIAMVVLAQTRHFSYHLGQLQSRLSRYSTLDHEKGIQKEDIP